MLKPAECHKINLQVSLLPAVAVVYLFLYTFRNVARKDCCLSKMHINFKFLAEFCQNLSDSTHLPLVMLHC